MDLTEKLRHWGNAYAAARSAERAVAREASASESELRREAQQLREHANQLHGDIYRHLDGR